MRLSHLLSEELVKVPLLGDTREEVIEELVDLLPICRDRTMRETVLEAVLSREKLESTAIGRGLAFPHGTAAIGWEMHLALGVTRAAVPFDAFDKEPVRIVCLLVGSEDSRQAQLKALSVAAGLLHDEEVREEFLEAKSAAEVMRIIRARVGDVDRADEITWRIHLMRERPIRAVAVLLVITGICYLIFRYYEPVFLPLAVGLFLIHLGPFFFPVHYRLSPEGVDWRILFFRSHRDWAQFRNFVWDDDGVKLSPFTFPSRLEPFRGCFLRFGGNREEVLAYLARRIRRPGEETPAPEEVTAGE